MLILIYKRRVQTLSISAFSQHTIFPKKSSKGKDSISNPLVFTGWSLVLRCFSTFFFGKDNNLNLNGGQYVTVSSTSSQAEEH